MIKIILSTMLTLTIILSATAQASDVTPFLESDNLEEWIQVKEFDSLNILNGNIVFCFTTQGKEEVATKMKIKYGQKDFLSNAYPVNIKIYIPDRLALAVPKKVCRQVNNLSYFVRSKFNLKEDEPISFKTSFDGEILYRGWL